MTAFFGSVDKSLNIIYRYCGYAAALCMVAIALLVLTSIVARLLAVYVPGLTEYSGYAMAAGSFLALANTFVDGGHIRVELVLARLGADGRRYAEVWCLGVAAIITGYVAFYMCRLVYFSWKFQQHSEGADAILLWKPQALGMTGAIILGVAVLHHLVKCLVSRDYAPR